MTIDCTVARSAFSTALNDTWWEVQFDQKKRKSRVVGLHDRTHTPHDIYIAEGAGNDIVIHEAWHCGQWRWWQFWGHDDRAYAAGQLCAPMP